MATTMQDVMGDYFYGLSIENDVSLVGGCSTLFSIRYFPLSLEDVRLSQVAELVQSEWRKVIDSYDISQRPILQPIVR